MRNAKLEPKMSRKTGNKTTLEKFDSLEFDSTIESDNAKFQDDSYDKEVMEKEISRRLDEFEADYDLSDMKINDRIVMRQLIQAIISLEDLETVFAKLRKDVTDQNLIHLDRVANAMNKLRSDISNMQNDLRITRKIRKEGKEENFISWLDNMKNKAAKYYEQVHLYIFCPHCKRLLATTWLLYPNSPSTLKLTCGNEDCGKEMELHLPDLYKTDNRNIQEVTVP